MSTIDGRLVSLILEVRILGLQEELGAQFSELYRESNDAVNLILGVAKQ